MWLSGGIFYDCSIFKLLNNQFIRSNHRGMNQEGYSTSCSRTKVPTNSTSTTTKKRSYSRESDAGTPEQLPIKTTYSQGQHKKQMDEIKHGKLSIYSSRIYQKHLKQIDAEHKIGSKYDLADTKLVTDENEEKKFYHSNFF